MKPKHPGKVTITHFVLKYGTKRLLYLKKKAPPPMKERVNRLGMWGSEETLAVTQLLSSWKVENRFMKFDFF